MNIVTRSRRLEQFFHVHAIHFVRQYKDEEGMNVWEYARTPETERILAEFKAVLARISEQKGA